MAVSDFTHQTHVQYFRDVLLQQLPGVFESSDPNRVTLAYFAVSALDLLNALDQVPVADVIDWVYSLQVLPLAVDDPRSAAVNSEPVFGFRGSSSIGIRFCSSGSQPILYDGGHLASTYSALSILRILGDDLSCIEHEALLNTVRGLQQPDGSFCPVQLGGERDLRFTYCAAAICSMLDDWSGMDVEKSVAYILGCQSYDDGFGMNPGLETHGAGTYLALASLKLMGRLDSKPPHDVGPVAATLDRPGLVGWCVRRQTESGGFQGRLNKPADTCYAFWVGSSLKMLGTYNLCNTVELRSFLLTCQSGWGGFSKIPNRYPDPLHSYYGICAFSLLEEPGLQPLCCELGFSMRASDA
ncbi:hypothetical protein KC19_5G027400 [Ceratodon purpureus]|uniref:Geranylgeranyl transferase type-1 subunit beta n=1 Tax=Ceratodon purpureus TaxID=3225 RepID=A0A8T0HXC2_CERPU|nr:hypothetical protein KC19_5G027400 [Ceratodon purpureus]